MLLGELGADNYERLFDRADQLDLVRGRGGAQHLHQGAAGLRPQVGVRRLAAAAGPRRAGLGRVRGHGRLERLVPGERAKKLTWQAGYSVAASPGTDGVYDFLSDSFTLPTGARRPDLSRDWLIECGSTEGQNLFNPLKGSIPARTDADAALYKGYLTWALEQWRDPKTRIVGSLTHGVVANNAYNAEIDSALGLFVQDGDPVKFADTLQVKYRETQ